MKRTIDIKILKTIGGIAIVTIVGACFLMAKWPKETWQYEIARSMISLGMIGVFGTIFKTIIDYAFKKSEKVEKFRLLIQNLETQIEEIIFKLDKQRILIRAHKSAKTYGNSIREYVMPIKKELTDIPEILRVNKDIIQNLNIQTIIKKTNKVNSYLDDLIIEFEKHYLSLADKQNHIEEFKKELIKNNVYKTLNDYLEKEKEKEKEKNPSQKEEIENEGELIELRKQERLIDEISKHINETDFKPLSLHWNSEINNLLKLGDFINIDSNSNYNLIVQIELNQIRNEISELKSVYNNI